MAHCTHFHLCSLPLHPRSPCSSTQTLVRRHKCMPVYLGIGLWPLNPHACIHRAHASYQAIVPVTLQTLITIVREQERRARLFESPAQPPPALCCCRVGPRPSQAARRPPKAIEGCGHVEVPPPCRRTIPKALSLCTSYSCVMVLENFQMRPWKVVRFKPDTAHM